MHGQETRMEHDGTGHDADAGEDGLPFDESADALRGRYLLGSVRPAYATAGSPERAAAILARDTYGPDYRVEPEAGSTYVWRVLDEGGARVARIGFRLLRPEADAAPIVGQVYLF